MAGFVIMGALAAFGTLCIGWLLAGACLTRPRGGALVYRPEPGSEDIILRRYLWLRELGLLRCPLVLIGSSLPHSRQRQITEKYPWVRFCTVKEIEEIG